MRHRPVAGTSCRSPYELYEPVTLRHIIPDLSIARALRKHGIPHPWRIVYARRR